MKKSEFIIHVLVTNSLFSKGIGNFHKVNQEVHVSEGRRLFGATGLSIISFLSFGLFLLVESFMSLGSFLPVASFVSLNHLCLLDRLCLLKRLRQLKHWCLLDQLCL